MQTISMEVEDTFYNDLEACALSNGYTSLEHCFINTMQDKVESYRAKVASQNIDRSDFINYEVPVVEEFPSLPQE